MLDAGLRQMGPARPQTPRQRFSIPVPRFGELADAGKRRFPPACTRGMDNWDKHPGAAQETVAGDGLREKVPRAAQKKNGGRVAGKSPEGGAKKDVGTGYGKMLYSVKTETGCKHGSGDAVY